MEYGVLSGTNQYNLHDQSNIYFNIMYYMLQVRSYNM